MTMGVHSWLQNYTVQLWKYIHIQRRGTEEYTLFTNTTPLVTQSLGILSLVRLDTVGNNVATERNRRLDAGIHPLNACGGKYSLPLDVFSAHSQLFKYPVRLVIQIKGQFQTGQYICSARDMLVCSQIRKVMSVQIRMDVAAVQTNMVCGVFLALCGGGADRSGSKRMVSYTGVTTMSSPQ